MFAFSFYTSHPNYLGNQGCKESFRRLLNLPLVEVSSFVSIPPPSFKVRHLRCYLFFRPPTAHPLPSQELPFVIFQVPLPCGFFTLIAPQTCGTHAMINVKLRSLVLIRMSQRNLLWSYSQHWGGCHRYPPPPPRLKCLSSNALRCPPQPECSLVKSCDFIELFKVASSTNIRFD